jgi:hypothetical protein
MSDARTPSRSPRARASALLVAFVALALGSAGLLVTSVGCNDGDEPKVSELGKLRGPCYPNLTCDHPLVCLSEVCVKLVDGGPDTASPELGPADAEPDVPPPCNACVTTVAGTGVAGFADGPGPQAQLAAPMALALAGDGRLFVADRDNHRIRVLGLDGQLTTVAGTGAAGFADGPALQAKFSSPSGLAFGDGKLYIADTSNHRIRRLVGDTVTTFAGIGTPGILDTSNSKASFNGPRGLARDGWDSVWIADTNNSRLRELRAGRAYSAVLYVSGIAGVAVDSAGTVYFTRSTEHLVYRYVGGSQRLLAGADKLGFLDGHLAAARFDTPQGLDVADDGLIVIADTNNNRIRIIRGDQVTTLAGASPGKADGPLADARFDGPTDVAIRPDGAVYVADTKNHVIRLIRP